VRLFRQQELLKNEPAAKQQEDRRCVNQTILERDEFCTWTAEKTSERKENKQALLENCLEVRHAVS
jgi:hypothetical protein